MIIESCDNHFYDEDHIKVGKPANCTVVVNHHTVEQKQQSVPAAMPKKPAKVKKQENTLQLSIFDV